VNGELKMQGETRQVIKAYSEHSKRTSGEIDLTVLPRRFEGNGAAKLLRLRSIQNENVAAWCYEYGTPLEFAVEFSVTRAIEEPGVGYAIFSSTGTELVSATTYQERPMDRLLPGQYSMRIVIPDLALNPGTYVLALGLVALGRNIDHVAEAAQIEILPSNQSIQRRLNEIYAPITPRTIFELKQI
jgi:hypothetical protein